MKTLLIAAAVAVLGTTGVQAADMAATVYTKAPLPEPFTWTGFYIGGNAGWSQTKSDFSTNVTPGAVGYFSPESRADIAVLGTGSAKSDGFTGGGQVGYNYQFAPSWVAGIEADMNELTSQKMSIFASGQLSGGTNITGFANSLEAQWMATVRGRVGSVKRSVSSIQSSGRVLPRSS